MLLEDFHGLIEMVNGLGLAYPVRKWVPELAAEQEAASLAALL